MPTIAIVFHCHYWQPSLNLTDRLSDDPQVYWHYIYLPSRPPAVPPPQWGARQDHEGEPFSWKKKVEKILKQNKLKKHIDLWIYGLSLHFVRAREHCAALDWKRTKRRGVRNNKRSGQRYFANSKWRTKREDVITKSKQQNLRERQNPAGENLGIY